MSEQQKNTKKKWNQRGFYIALSVCLVAVGVAAWTTYSGITNQLRQVDTTISAVANSQPSSQPLVSQTEPESKASSAPESRVSAPSSSAPKSSSAPSQSAPKSSSPASQSTRLTSAPVSAEPAAFFYPMEKKISKAYSGDRLVYSQTMQDWRVHAGMDLSGKIGDPVCAIAEGQVKDIYEDAMLGNVISISHGSVEALYCGLGDTALVKKGESVKAGQKIGSVGTVPMELTEEPHLHLELLQNDVRIDPAELLSESQKTAS